MTGTTATPSGATGWRRHVLLAIHICAIALSCVLIGYITYDSLLNISFVADPRYLRVQFWICLYFMADVLLEAALSPRHWHTLWRNMLFLLVCVPYLNIISHYHLSVPPVLQYVLRFLPMLRAAYVLSILAGLLSGSWITNMFRGYLSLLVLTVYFGALVFYVSEHAVNPDITGFWAALWWAVMDVSTCGCFISPMTPTGKVLSVILSAEGLILFPVFTVYLTQALTRSRSGEPTA